MDPNVTQQKTIFVWRRLEEPMFKYGNQDVDGHWWLAVLIPLLLLAFIYVVWMYVRDGRSIGWLWGIFLAGLRCSVYAVLTVMFLMPATQIIDESISRFKVIVV